MTSIKDKPLKKITGDTRVKIDFLHNNKIEQIDKNMENINNTNKEIDDLNKLKDISDINKCIEIDNKIVFLKNKIKNYDNNEYIEYYLDNAMLLSEYYSNEKKNPPNNNTKKKSVLEFMKDKQNEEDDICENIPVKCNNIIHQYMVNTNDEFTNHTEITNINTCKICKNKLIIRQNESELICDKCGYTEKIIYNIDSNSYKDPIRESTYFAYKRINHFNEWLAQFQAKETTDISEDIYNNILKELKKDKNFTVDNVSYKLIRDTLKKLGYNKYYEHIPHIINIITGKKNPILDRNNEEQLRIMFKEIQQPFMNNCPDDRKNFLSYAYVLHKFCELLELDELLIYFPLLKSREKLQQQDFIWKKICHDLKWQFIPSI